MNGFHNNPEVKGSHRVRVQALWTLIKSLLFRRHVPPFEVGQNVSRVRSSKEPENWGSVVTPRVGHLDPNDPSDGPSVQHFYVLVFIPVRYTH